MTAPGDTLPRAAGRRVDAAAAGEGPLTGVPGFGPQALVTLVWDDGIRHCVRTPTVFGRNPGVLPGWSVVAVRDETLSVSRTHLAVGGRHGDVWIADTGSTNGTEIVRGSDRHRVAPGERWIVRTGDILELGDRRVRVEGV